MALAYIRPRIGVVELFGTVGSTIRTPSYGEIFSSLRLDGRFKAVVLDIDSPGGSVAASDYLYRSVSKLAESKPVVAFIRGIGASGAYLLSCAAHHVVALPGSLVGSVGVISLQPILADLLQRIGISVNVNKSGHLKDMGAPYRAPTPEESQKLQALVDEFYDTFVSMVAQGRKLEEEKVRELATGEVFTAAKAKELGLVDELGDLDRAIDLASEMGNVVRRPVYIRPRRTLRERLFGRMANSFVEAISEEVERRLTLQVMASLSNVASNKG